MHFREIRKAFLEFFKVRGHEIVESSSLIPKDDPTLLFTNAGMVQFKKLFLGEEKRPYKRAATAQKCMRAGGKHNDLENVGFTHRHHTYFEMLGNFSFGDYFKKEAILWAWELLTQVYKLNQENLYVSVYQEDDEAYGIWEREIGLPSHRIVRLGQESNFWTMGDTGPCGPCSEIYQDLGPEMGCGRPDCGPGCDCDRYLEVWNLVFTQFDRAADGTLTPLSHPNIDTGMGLERVCSVIQGVKSNFETDLFRPLIERIEDLAGTAYGLDNKKDSAFRVIADHARAISFLVADGVMPSNEGRGYVLRRVIRRSLRFGLNLGLKESFLWPVCQRVLEIMGEDYPELIKARDAIKGIVINEGKRFSYTLEYGMRVLEEYLQGLKDKGDKVIPGEMVFRLYDTYGLSADILEDVAREEGLSLDMEGYRSLMEAQRLRSQEAWKGGADYDVPSHLKDMISQGISTTFLGYETTLSKGVITHIFCKGEPVKEARTGEECEIILDRTPFYGEAGGQVGDKGRIVSPTGSFVVLDTKRYGQGLFVHLGKVEQGALCVAQEVEAEVFKQERERTRRHHTSTHLLHAALRYYLGEHVKQAGSLVSPNRLRFDFTHFSQVDQGLLREIERFVNDAILRNIPVNTHIMSKKEAMETGAMAIFEEKYGEVVRVVEIGDVSKELCGGTHVRSTGEIGLFKILNESGIASNVRRIEALAGDRALGYVHEQEDLIRSLTERLKVGANDLPKKLDSLIREQKELQKEIERLNQRLVSKSKEELLGGLREIKGIRVISRVVDANSPKQLRGMGDHLKAELKSGVIVLGAASDDKAMLLCNVTQDLVGKIKAGQIIQELSKVVGGSGGGRPDMAQGGGPKKESLGEAIQMAYGLIDKLLG